MYVVYIHSYLEFVSLDPCNEADGSRKDDRQADLPLPR